MSRVKNSGSKSSEPLIGKTRLNAILCLLLAGVTVVLYAPVAGFPFLVLDDHDYVTANTHVQRGLHWSTVHWAFTSFAAANWHPLTWLSHAFDCQLFGLNPAGHHLDSVAIHALNAVALFLVLAWLTRRTWPSLLVAALFAVHPLNVESVTWVAERKNVLSTFFFLLAIAAYGFYARRPDWRRYLLLAGLFAAGLMAKPMVITLPFVLLLLDYWPLERMSKERMSEERVSPPGDARAAEHRGAEHPGIDLPPPVPASRLLLEKVPLLALSAASAWITLKAQRSGYAVRTLSQFSFGARLENSAAAYVLYIWKALWPSRLAFGYPFAAAGLPAWQWILSILALAAITVLVVVFRRRRYLPVGWFWFLGTLVPVIGLVQVGDAAMADRYAYIPLIGIFVMIAWGLADLVRARKFQARWIAVPTVCVLITLGATTHRQIGYWASEYDLWSHTLEATGNPFAHDALGAALLDPGLALSKSDLASFENDDSRFDEARRHLEQALVIRRELARQNPNTYLPDMAVTLNNLGNLARSENKLDEARQYYEEGVQIHSQLARQNVDPYPSDYAMALTNLGYLERSRLENDKALQHFGAALELYRQLAQQNPDQYLSNVAEVLNSLAVTERDEKRLDIARRDYEEALRIRRHLVIQKRNEYLPNLAMTLNDLGVLDAAENRADGASQHYQEALNLYRQLATADPDTYTRYLAGSLNNLAFLYANEKRFGEARKDYTEALTLYQKLFEADPGQYAGDVARVEASLKQLDKKTD